MPVGYFNPIALPEALDFRALGTPDTTCKADVAQCVPNPITIPNPYAYPILPPAPPKPTPNPHPSPAVDSNLDKYIAYGAIVAVIMIILISVFAYKKCIRKDTRNDDALISEA